MNSFLNSLQNRIVISLGVHNLMYFGGIGLPAELLAFFDNGMNIFGADATDHRFDFIGLRYYFFILAILI